jgi:hypothetical protein
MKRKKDRNTGKEKDRYKIRARGTGKRGRKKGREINMEIERRKE